MKKIKNGIRIVAVLLNLILIITISQVLATETVTHDFEGSVDEWVFQNWEKSVSGTIPISNSDGFSIQDGILRAPKSSDLNTFAVAYTNSSVAYGTWEFDWFVGGNNFDIVPFIFNDLVNNYNQTGLTEDEWIRNCTGYGLFMQDFDEISLISYYHYGKGLEAQLGGVQFAPLALGVHKIKVTRSTEGVFDVYLDSQLQFTATDNNVTTSSVFHINSFQGDSGFDNIKISDSETTDGPTPFVEIGYFLPILIFVVVFSRIDRKRREI